MNLPKKIILITGGAGFIGSHLTRLFVNKYLGYLIVNLDKLTYAGNLENLKAGCIHKNDACKKLGCLQSFGIKNIYAGSVALRFVVNQRIYHAFRPDG